ncbi:hypothetical protein HYC85_026627 [Camellia sinensis]|uniref:Expansin n=1 Tax=Camellia sinensis TaxID=4442 RepID=A0A7J7G7S8_CAMSI|nr:hypothetical protein HYC85_026627 [Camellia sinensis]
MSHVIVSAKMISEKIVNLGIVSKNKIKHAVGRAHIHGNPIRPLKPSHLLKVNKLVKVFVICRTPKYSIFLFFLGKRCHVISSLFRAPKLVFLVLEVPCVRKGGLRFSFQGNGYWLLVYVMNVGGGGDISGMWVKGSRTGWISMSHNWGASYQAFATLNGQSLSFKVTSYTTKETLIAYNVSPSNWNFGSTYQANVNFH